jgi:hypothetical protein
MAESASGVVALQNEDTLAAVPETARVRIIWAMRTA